MKKQLPGWAVLLIITLVAGLALGGTYALTKEPIAQQALLQAEAARKAALPEAESFRELTLPEGAPVDWANAGLRTVKGKAVPLKLEDIDAISGATYTSTAVVEAINAAYAAYQAAPSDAAFHGEAQGFIGPVAVEAAFDGDTIAALKIGDERFMESENFGAKALEESFQSQFTGGEKVIGYVSQITVKGYKGPVEVTVGLDNELTLTGISVGGSDFAETAGLGAKAKEPAFQSQFAGKKTPVTLIKQGGTPGDDTVDAITAATITSTAVSNGVNTVAKFVKSEILGIVGIEMPARPGDDQVFSASAKGFRGPVYVEAAFDENGQVSYISVGDDQFAEDIGAGVKEPEFMQQFIGKPVPASVADIDAISGATVSSTAVVTALNEAYNASKGVAPVPTEAPKAITLPEKPAEGVYGASAQGFRGPVYVEAAFDENGQVSYISVGDDQFAEDIGAGVKEPEFMQQFIGRPVPASVADIDAISGATVSSTAVVTALNEAYNASRGAANNAPAEEPQASERSASAQILCGRSTLDVGITAENGVLTALTVSEKAEGAAQFAPCEEEAAMQALFVGQKLPLSVQYDAAHDFCVAAAINQAYAKIDPDAKLSLPAIEPAGKPAEAPAPIPTAEPAPEATAEPVPDARIAPADSDLGYSGSALVFFSLIRADMSFENGVITEAALLEKAVNGPDYAPMAQGAALQAQLIGQKAPVSAADIHGVPAYRAAAVAQAVNDAFTLYQADEQQAPAEDGEPAAYTGEALAYFTAVKVEADFADGKLTTLRVLDRPADGKEYALSSRNEEMQKKFLGEALPLSVRQDSAYASAVAAAINQAYPAPVHEEAPAAEEKPEAEQAPEADNPKSVGRCVMFFDRYTVSAAFDGNLLADFEIYEAPVGDDEMILWESSPLYATLPGRTMPLNVKEFKASYVEQAIVIALNEAYAQSLAGQQ